MNITTEGLICEDLARILIIPENLPFKIRDIIGMSLIYTEKGNHYLVTMNNTTYLDRSWYVSVKEITNLKMKHEDVWKYVENCSILSTISDEISSKFGKAGFITGTD